MDLDDTADDIRTWLSVSVVLDGPRLLIPTRTACSAEVSCDSPISAKQVVCDMLRPITQLTGSPDSFEFGPKDLIHPG